MGLFVPGTTLLVAKATSRNAIVQSTTEKVCQLYSKSRPAGQFRKWTTLSRFDESQPVPRRYDTLLAGAANTDAVPRTRVCSLEPVFLLCRITKTSLHVSSQRAEPNFFPSSACLRHPTCKRVCLTRGIR